MNITSSSFKTYSSMTFEWPSKRGLRLNPLLLQEGKERREGHDHNHWQLTRNWTVSRQRKERKKGNWRLRSSFSLETVFLMNMFASQESVNQNKY
jgi:hypothetical protein